MKLNVKYALKQGGQITVVLAFIACDSRLTVADVKPLNPDLIPAAIQRGQQARKSDDIFTLFDGVRTPRFSGSGRPRGFSVMIRTPLSEVAYRAFEAKRKYEPFGVDSVVVQPLHEQSVIIIVEPSTNLGGYFKYASAPASIFSSVQKVVLRRGQDIITPLHAKFHDVVFSTEHGKRDTYKGGEFIFPLQVFDPALGPLEIVVIPQDGEPGDEAIKKLKVKDLQKLE